MATYTKTAKQGTTHTVTVYNCGTDAEAEETWNLVKEKSDTLWLSDVPLRNAKAWLTKELKKYGWNRDMEWMIINFTHRKKADIYSN